MLIRRRSALFLVSIKYPASLRWFCAIIPSWSKHKTPSDVYFINCEKKEENGKFNILNLWKGSNFIDIEEVWNYGMSCWDKWLTIPTPIESPRTLTTVRHRSRTHSTLKRIPMSEQIVITFMKLLKLLIFQVFGFLSNWKDESEIRKTQP